MDIYNLNINLSVSTQRCKCIVMDRDAYRLGIYVRYSLHSNIRQEYSKLKQNVEVLLLMNVHSHTAIVNPIRTNIENYTISIKIILFWRLGPILGSALYSLGGFPLPFISVGSVGIILAICLLFAIPSGEYEKSEPSDSNNREKLTWSKVIQV